MQMGMIADVTARFRWTTLHRALDVLMLHSTNAEMKSVIEEVGCGPDLDRTPSTEQTTPKLKNLLSKASRQEPPRLDPDGDLILNRLVREAAARVPDLRQSRPWDHATAERHPTDAAFERSLAVDGWTLRDGGVAPITPVPLEEVRSNLRQALDALGGGEALRRLDQFEKGLDEGHWESANGDARGFLASVFDTIADQRLPGGPKDGAARHALQAAGFFRPDPRDASKSVEGRFVASLFEMLGSEGAHTGASDGPTATYRYGLCILTADHFLSRPN